MINRNKLYDELLDLPVPGAGTTIGGSFPETARLVRKHPVASGMIALALSATTPDGAGSATALRIGGLAFIAGLAYCAFQKYRDGRPTDRENRNNIEILPAPMNTSFHPSHAPQGETEFELTLVRAMIAAANADGRINEAGIGGIKDRLSVSGLDIENEAEELLIGEIKNPVSVDALVAAVSTDAQKVELYTAARLAADTGSLAEQEFLSRLAAKLKLPAGLIEHVETTVRATEG